jgi:hypothetical protein
MLHHTSLQNIQIFTNLKNKNFSEIVQVPAAIPAFAI